MAPLVPSLRVEMADQQLGPEQCPLGRLPVELGLGQGPDWPAGVCLHVPVELDQLPTTFTLNRHQHLLKDFIIAVPFCLLWAPDEMTAQKQRI